MKTLTVTKARQTLGAWLKRAAQGEDIGVIVGGEIVAFRPVRVYAEDYAQCEYGLSGTEATRFVRRAETELANARRRKESLLLKGRLTRRAL